MEVLDRSPGDRDSHDLSYNFTRFSVVDSMLSSLTDLPTATGSAHASAFNEYDTNDIYAQTQKPQTSNTGRRRGHTQSSSMTDYDVHVDEIASRYTAYHSRNSRPSGTSKKQKETSSRNGSVRSNAAPGARENGPIETESTRHTRGTGFKGSKGSGSSSVDLGYPNAIPTGRFGNAPSRAASFDHSYGERVARSSPEKMLLRSMAPSQPVPVDYTAIDAAPMPTVPAGPRRPQEPISPVYMPPLTPKKSAPSRKNSVKSTAAKSVRKSKSSAPLEADIRDQAKQFVHATNSLRSQHATTGPAPSPTVGTLRKAYPSPPAHPPAPKEQRPGFFRRVFGSSKHSQSSQHDDIHRPPSPAAIRQVPATSSSNRPRTQPNQQHIATQLKPSQSRPPTQGEPSFSRDQMPPATLRKAHSSFFRRRKKSLSENGPPPVPPLQVPVHPAYAQLKITAPQRSPSNMSLRGAMAPYLNEKAVSPQETYFDSHEHQPLNELEDGPIAHGLSVPVPSQHRERDAASNRALDSLRQGTNGEVGDRLLKTEGGEGPSMTSRDRDREPLTMKNTKPRTGPPAIAGDLEGGSFLVDSSSNEAMGNGNSSPADPDDLPKFRKHSIPTSDPFGRPHSNKENVTPPRRANIGEKRADVHILSPISDRSQLPSDHEHPQFFDDDDDEFVVAPATAREETSLNSASSNRVWLEPSSSDEKLGEAARLRLPLEGPRTTDRAKDQLSPTSENDIFASATSLPIVQVESRELRMSQDWADTDAAKAILTHDTDITAADRERARRILEGDEEFVSKAGAAAWLGQTTPKSSRTRRAYMELFDFNGVNILASFRELCNKLVVKAESQQLDRVIDAFSERWCNSNPNHGFKDRDVVHTITFSILMLNTDLHVADLDQRMTRSQFVKNTLPTIRSIADAAAPGATDTIQAKARQARSNIPWDHPSTPSSPVFPETPATDDRDRPSLEVKKSMNRLSIRPSARQDSDGTDATDNCNVLVKAPYEGTMKGWEFQVEIVLKEFYNSIRQQRLPLHGANTHQVQTQPSQTGLSVMSSALRRTPSVLSKAPSDSISYRGRTSDSNRYTGRFGSKPRSRPRIYPTSTIGSSRTSLDDQSVWSPAGSTWSKYSLGKTQTSMSVDSLGSHFGHGDYQQAIGFANALSQAIIREEGVTSAPGSDDFNGRVVPLLEDDTLELVGPPWAKEGIVKHKHHLETLEKKAKERNWSECFAVIEKGWMRLFSFNMNSKSMRQRAKTKAASGFSRAGGVVGGGNWSENAEELSAFLLRQTIASALPPPGYSKSRSHVFALSLPTGAVHLFQVGTPDIVKEFVSTANYWSARLSKEPLIGGVSNIEYGWGDSVIHPAVLQSRPDSASPAVAPGTSGSNSSHVVTLNPSRHSVISPMQSPSSGIASIGRRSEDQGTGVWKARLPGDRVPISEWTPPVQSMMASQLMEVDQLRALTAYVANVEDELRKHNELRPLMGMAFSPRHPNAGKAMANWEKKSAYLLREIVKFRTYIDSLAAAQTAKERLYKDREAMGLTTKAAQLQQASSTTDADSTISNPNITTNDSSAPASSANTAILSAANAVV